MPLLARDGVEAPVCSVNEVHVGHTGRTVQVPRPFGPSDHRMAGRVIRPEVRLRFDNATGHDTIRSGVLQNRSEQLAGDELGGTIVERWWQRPSHRLTTYPSPA